MVLPTNVKLLVDDALSQQGVIPRDWVHAFEWLRVNTDQGTRVMTSVRVGSFTGRYAERRVYVGHAQQTLDYQRKRQMAGHFFDPRTPEPRWRTILMLSRCQYVAADADQSALLRDRPGLQPVFSSPQMTIYRVSTPGGS